MPDLSLEQRLHQSGYAIVAGVDEAGRGPLAGPVVAAAVVLPPGLAESAPWLNEVDDSKRLSPGRRSRVVESVEQYALDSSVGVVGNDEVDRVGIGRAAIQAMLRAVAGLAVPPDHLLLDYVPLRECDFPFEALVKGDQRSYSIAAASNVAKVFRDRLMEWADAAYPGYDFAKNKGYPTPDHLARLKDLGPCQIHRRSFAPVRAAADLWGVE